MKAVNKQSRKASQNRHKPKKVKGFALSPRNLFIAILLFSILGTLVWKYYYLIQSDASAPRPYNNFVEISDQGLLSPPKSAKQTSDAHVPETTHRQLVFSNPRSEQQDAHIVLDADLPERVSGVCKFRFEQTTSVFETSSTLSNASTCGSRVALSRFPRGGTWHVSIQFASRDGLISAAQASFSFYILK